MADATETKESKDTAQAKEPSATPVFGSAATFGAETGGFGGFSGVAESKQAPKAEAAEGDGEGAGEEEDCSAEFQPVVQLVEIETVSGEEAENVLVDFKSKLYRFDHESGEWKERGVGQVRLLENKENDRIRLLHRQEKTLKIRANHILMPGTKLQEHTGSEKAWVWSAVDFADEVQKPELFCIRFASVERAQEFKKSFDEAVAKNAFLLDDTEGEANGSGASDADSAVEAPAAPSPADELAAKTEKLAVSEAASNHKP